MNNTDLLSAPAQSADSATSPAGSDSELAAGGSNGKRQATATRKRTGLSGMVLAELRELAGELGITGTAGMRKGDLITAIKQRQGATGSSEKPAKAAKAVTSPERAADGGNGKQLAFDGGSTEPTAPVVSQPTPDEASADSTGEAPSSTGGNRRRRSSARSAGSPDSGHDDGRDSRQDSGRDGRGNRDNRQDQRQQDGRQQSGRNDRQQGGNGQGGHDKRQSDNRQDSNRQDSNRQDSNRDGRDDDDGRGRRGRRFRDRRRGRGGGRTEHDIEVREDDVLLPVAGILDVLDNYAFVRTSGYLAGPNDVYVSLSLVRKYSLRRGDNITGQIRQPREGEQQRQKFNPLVRVDTVNGLEPEKAKNRPEFHKLVPLYPNERLRLETEPHILTTRVIDLVMPVGKGQRALIQSPPKAGKTTILQNIANAITKNNPECHLMVVLVDERPEEVTDMQRSVEGEVIASTFDRPPGDHTSVAELSIERAKRLVEMGHDVVVLMDSITRLGRAYNLAAPASGRILSGGVDSTALYPPKRFLGAARNIEHGGSLTIFATAMVETGSTMDTVIFEEFKGTGNAELKLDRKIAERRVFPAVDVTPSGTRKEELLLSPDEYAVMVKLHRVLNALDSQQAIDLLISRLKKTKTNIEFLMQVSRNAPGTINGSDD